MLVSTMLSNIVYDAQLLTSQVSHTMFNNMAALHKPCMVFKPLYKIELEQEKERNWAYRTWVVSSWSGHISYQLPFDFCSSSVGPPVGTLQLHNNICVAKVSAARDNMILCSIAESW